jgi:hypothetical protein
MNRRSLLASFIALLMSPRSWFAKAPPIDEHFGTLGLQFRGYRTFADVTRDEFINDEIPDMDFPSLPLDEIETEKRSDLGGTSRKRQH